MGYLLAQSGTLTVNMIYCGFFPWPKRYPTMRRTLLIITALFLMLGTYLSVAYIPHEVAHTVKLPILKTPGKVGLYYEDFETFPAGENLKLAGWWMPAQQAKAILVFIHGGSSNRHSDFFKCLKFYRTMVHSGVSVAAIDLRNHGDSDSDGQGIQLGRSEQADARAAIHWARERDPELPIFAMGISMGGATVIHAAAAGADIEGLVLVDPLLDTRSAIRRAAWVQTGLPEWIFSAGAWAATEFHGLPYGENNALEVAAELDLPILLIQDPDDPVILATYARELSQRNQHVDLWEAPLIAGDHPEIPWRGRWGTHVAAFTVYPELVRDQILDFLAQNTHRR